MGVLKTIHCSQIMLVRLRNGLASAALDPILALCRDLGYSVRFLDEEGEPLAGLFGGEVVELEITGRVMREIPAPIVGFYVQDRLGQVLFSDNTALGASQAREAFQAGSGFRADPQENVTAAGATDGPAGVLVQGEKAVRPLH